MRKCTGISLLANCKTQVVHAHAQWNVICDLMASQCGVGTVKAPFSSVQLNIVGRDGSVGQPMFLSTNSGQLQPRLTAVSGRSRGPPIPVS